MDRTEPTISATVNIHTGMELDFLGWLFPRDPLTGHYRVTATNVVGEAASYLAIPSEYPVEPPEREGYVACTLDLPRNPHGDDRRWRFARYPDFAQVRLNHLLDSFFELDFYRYYLKGMQYGYEKRDVVETYVLSRGLAGNDPNRAYDALHKRAYRSETRALKARAEVLRRKARYFFDEPKDKLPRK